jgi:Autotransporter beta-domain
MGGIDTVWRGLATTTDGLVVGLLGGYTISRVELRDSPTTQEFSGPSAGIYGTYLTGNWFFDFLFKVDLASLEPRGRCSFGSPSRVTPRIWSILSRMLPAPPGASRSSRVARLRVSFAALSPSSSSHDWRQRAPRRRVQRVGQSGGDVACLGTWQRRIGVWLPSRPGSAPRGAILGRAFEQCRLIVLALPVDRHRGEEHKVLSDMGGARACLHQRDRERAPSAASGATSARAHPQWRYARPQPRCSKPRTGLRRKAARALRIAATAFLLPTPGPPRVTDGRPIRRLRHILNRLPRPTGVAGVVPPTAILAAAYSKGRGPTSV